MPGTLQRRLAPAALLLAALLGLWGAARQNDRLADARARQGLRAGAALADAPPAMTFITVALGGFRGILADVLWLRALRLQDERRFFEIAQLSDWITKLQPHFASVWAFQAWNMAYNISVLFPDPETRWRWVGQGIRLLRDDGLRYNPQSPALCRELGWLYQHKIGYIMDSAHAYYKRRLAEDVQAAFGGPRPARSGGTPDEAPGRRRNALNLDPVLMAGAETEYGPLDWRVPESHALFWAWRGRQLALEAHARPGAHAALRGCDVMIYQSLAALFRKGRLAFEPGSGRYLATPDLAVFPRAIRAYEEALARHGDTVFHEAFANFLGEAAIVFYGYGHYDQARACYEDLLRRYAPEDGAPPFDQYVRDSLTRMQQPESDLAPENAVAAVEGLFYRAFDQAADGQADRAAESDGQARRFWDVYMRARVSDDHRRRTGLPPPDALRRAAWERIREEPADPARAAALAALEPAVPEL